MSVPIGMSPFERRRPETKTLPSNSYGSLASTRTCIGSLDTKIASSYHSSSYLLWKAVANSSRLSFGRH